MSRSSTKVQKPRRTKLHVARHPWLYRVPMLYLFTNRNVYRMEGHNEPVCLAIAADKGRVMMLAYSPTMKQAVYVVARDEAL